MGVECAAALTGDLAATRLDKDITPEEVRETLAVRIADILDPIARPLVLDSSHAPHVVLVVGVNGTGKTTTIGKLAKQWRDQGHSVMLAACDTFRAAAIEQLQAWGERSGCPVVVGRPGADAAGLAYAALAGARGEAAGRL